MNNQDDAEKFSLPDAEKSVSGEGEKEKDSSRVNIQPSETDTESEDNAPGRTAGKAEGSRQIVEQDLEDKKTG